VQLPDGRPAAGATVVVRVEHKWQRGPIHLHNGRLRDLVDEVWAKTDDQGRFVIYPEKDKFDVAAIHPDGFRAATSEEVRQGEPIMLEPWAIVDVTLRQSPDHRQSAGLTSEAKGSPLVFQVFVGPWKKPEHSAKVLLPPGTVHVQRTVDGVVLSAKPLDLAPAETKDVELGPPTQEDVELAQEKRREAHRKGLIRPLE
jgi:hypothetical protein